MSHYFTKSYSTPSIPIQKKKTQTPVRSKSDPYNHKIVQPEPRKIFFFERQNLKKLLNSSNYLDQLTEMLPQKKKTFFQKSKSLNYVHLEQITPFDLQLSGNRKKTKKKSRRKKKQKRTMFNEEGNLFSEEQKQKQKQKQKQEEEQNEKQKEKEKEKDKENEIEIENENENENINNSMFGITIKINDGLDYEDEASTGTDTETESDQDEDQQTENTMNKIDLEIERLIQEKNQNFSNNVKCGTNTDSDCRPLAFTPPKRVVCPLRMDQLFVKIGTQIENSSSNTFKK
ncbi:hypothetical protein M0812_16402 [Anaeramoeba flamelloides]|uniref:Uncharacterized protein n=1 Tax=Anaeramoeba flamelloides TaxID=1746091 RepID=A0AAV7ZGQ7_9EUKA|nr:hypothetical protein M0812_16402 [Anaeramoeba flamelloides]